MAVQIRPVEGDLTQVGAIPCSRLAPPQSVNEKRDSGPISAAVLLAVAYSNRRVWMNLKREPGPAGDQGGHGEREVPPLQGVLIRTETVDGNAVRSGYQQRIYLAT